MANHHAKYKHARPKIQREFFSWFAKSRHLFSTPLSISQHTKKFIELTFTDANSLVSVTLTSCEINVGFHWKGISWDLLICFEAIPAPKLGYYVCSLCNDPDEDFYVSREVLWQLHLFEPFLEWVNNQLTKSPWIEIYGQEAETTSARLLTVFPMKNQAIDSKTTIIANPMHKAE